MCNLPSSKTAHPRRLFPLLEPLEGRLLLTFYSIMDLGTLGGASSYGFDINNSNQVVGYAKLATGADRAFLFNDANDNGIADPGEMVNLGTLAGYPSSYGYAINNDGIIVGTVVTAFNARKAVRFQPTGSPTDLQMGIASSAYDININGEIVGATQIGLNYFAAYRSPTGEVTQLGALGGGFPYSEAFAINDSGTIVGYSSTDTGDSAFILPAGGSMSAIGFENQPIFYEYDYAWGINNGGQIAGEGFNSQQEYRGFRYDNGSITDLGIPSGFTTTQALAINSSGVIVGHGRNSADEGRAFIYSDGVAMDLNSLIPTNSGWTLIKARSINDNGYIVGEGISPAGQARAFLLRPATNVLTISGDQQSPDQDDTIKLQRSAVDPSRVDVFLNSSTPTSSFIAADYIHVFVNGGGGNDRITLDFANGAPFPSGGISVDGQAAGADSLEILGSSVADGITVSTSRISIGSAAANFSNIEAMQLSGGGGDDATTINGALPFTPAFNGGSGNDSLTVSTGSYTLASDVAASSVEHLVLQGSATLNLEASQHLSSLILGGTSRLNLLPHGSRFIRANDFIVGNTATVDLADNDLIIENASVDTVLATVTDLIRRARNAQTRWGGAGLTSSAAASNSITGLAAVINNNGSGGTIRGNLSGETLGTNMVLVVYTYDGDMDINGQINADDYARIDSGYAQKLNGYAWGDLDYSGGPPDSDDYFHIDRAFADQGAPLVSEVQVNESKAASSSELQASLPVYSVPSPTAASRGKPAGRRDLFSKKRITLRSRAAETALAIWEDLRNHGRPAASVFWVASQRSWRRLFRLGV